ncbi:hypothetical protein NKG94_00890 [Micromonospora sp. M12]
MELGPGTGAFTTAIQQRLAGGPAHRRRGQSAFRTATGRAAPGGRRGARERHRPRRGARPAWAPPGRCRGQRPSWAAFAENHQRDVLSSVVAALPPHGVFTTFAYVHTRWAAPSRRLLRSVRSLFDEVVVSRTEWVNLPPALVYYCRRPWAEPSILTEALPPRGESGRSLTEV